MSTVEKEKLEKEGTKSDGGCCGGAGKAESQLETAKKESCGTTALKIEKKEDKGEAEGSSCCG